MISASSLGTHGRIGNQLWQVACVLGTAEKNNTEAVFPEWEYEKYFEQALPHGAMSKITYLEKQYHYQEITGTDLDLHGYWQSQKYFPKDYRPKFKKEFLEPLKAHEAFTKETIGIHIRRGDYVTNPKFNSLYFQLPVTWFISALVSIEGWQDKNIVIVSDDLPYVKIHFGALNNVYFMEGTDIEDLAYYSLCDTQIMANSTYSWWGCFLSEKQNGIHSGKMFAGDFAGKDIRDFYLGKWKLHDNFKLDLADLTFTIPVFCDSKDRKQNLDLNVCILQTNFDTNIIIGEQGNSFEYFSQWCKYMSFDLPHFHRTKMLNDMALASETPYIANWDADVIIAPLQIYLSVMKLREGADMVFPYDGRFARLPREQWFKPIEKSLDIGVIGDTEPKGKRGRPVPEYSVGGAVFFNKESFCDGGMENEFMISFGPEDCERNDRFKKLGFKVERVCELKQGLGGPLYHIDHWCGPDSTPQNPFFKKNHAELEKGRAMTREELRLYVDTFPWRHRYTEAYYKRIEGGAAKSAAEVYRILPFDFETIIDIGCGIGEWKFKNYTGVDYNTPFKPERYINCDLETGTVNFTWTYDFCLCLEVAEHLSEERADILIEMLCNLSDRVLFSAAIPGQGGTGHINCQWQSWWAEKFEANGFFPYKTDLRKALFHNDNCEVWYRNNLILYTRKKFKIDYELDFVHPKMFTSCLQHYQNQLAQ